LKAASLIAVALLSRFSAGCAMACSLTLWWASLEHFHGGQKRGVTGAAQHCAPHLVRETHVAGLAGIRYLIRNSA
jgi:hypothetical protein